MPHSKSPFTLSPASTRDPAVYSFAHGGKDGTPYSVDRKNYDRSIDVIKTAVVKARIGDREKVEALKRLGLYYGEEVKG